MTRLHQIIAMEKTLKSAIDGQITAVYHEAQKPALFQGLVKTYEPLDEEGLVYPGESQKVLYNGNDLLKRLATSMANLIDFTVTKDTANTQAKADIILDERVLARDVPVTTLLWLEKQLVHLRTVIGDFPTTDPAETWTWSESDGQWRNSAARTLRQKKVDKFVTVAPATDKHAAQVVKVTEDVPEGWWQTQKLSGALAPTRKTEMLLRVTALLAAVKSARETANQIEVTDRSIGEDVLNFVFS